MVPKNSEGKTIEVKKNNIFRYKSGASYNKVLDADLWNAFLSGDNIAFELIYKNYAARLYSYGLHICKNRELVEDCLHDLFIYIYQQRATLGKTDSIQFYLYRSLRRRIVEEISKDNRIMAEDVSFNTSKVTETIPSFELEMIESQNVKDRTALIQKALGDLTKKQREIIYLLYFNCLTYSEVAAIMDIELRTVYNQVYNAMNHLKRYIKRSLFP